MLSKQQQQIIDISGVIEYRTSESGELMTSCPFCGHENYKFWVSSDAKFHCWVCGVGGAGMASFISQYYKMSYKESLAYIKTHNLVSTNSLKDRITSNDLQDKLLMKSSDIVPSKLTIPSLPTNTKKIIDNIENPEALPFINYLKRRGITRDDFLSYDFRYVVEGEMNINNNRKMDITNHIIFVTHKEGVPVYWATRSIEPNPYIKSFNAHSNKDEYSKNEVFFNIDRVSEETNLVICEGVFNALSCTFDDYTGVATFGKNITDTQIKNMIRLNPKSYYIFLDNDAKSLSIRLAQSLIRLGIEMDRIHLVNNPYGSKDANELGKDISKNLIKSSPSLSYYEMVRQKMEMRL